VVLTEIPQVQFPAKLFIYFWKNIQKLFLKEYDFAIN